jgi:hypothetical protein
MTNHDGKTDGKVMSPQEFHARLSGLLVESNMAIPVVVGMMLCTAIDMVGGARDQHKADVMKATFESMEGRKTTEN